MRFKALNPSAKFYWDFSANFHQLCFVFHFCLNIRIGLFYLFLQQYTVVFYTLIRCLFEEKENEIINFHIINMTYINIAQCYKENN